MLIINFFRRFASSIIPPQHIITLKRNRILLNFIATLLVDFRLY
jgi:hypothetical protein